MRTPSLAVLLLAVFFSGALAACGATGIAPPPYTDGGRVDAYVCGLTCGPGTLCVRDCLGSPSCVPVPSTCGAAPACGCFSLDPCGRCGSCQAVRDGMAICACAQVCP